MSTNAPRSRWTRPPRLGGAVPSLWWLLVAVALIAGTALRLVLSRTPLWLDEAQTVAIASLPLGELPTALRQDGHPPLYYALLHGWIRWWGAGDTAVRSLSALFGLASLVPLSLLARRVAGRTGAGAAVALGATSPFLVRYATEARMYALVVLLSLVWWLAVLAAWRRPSPAALAAVAAAAAALLWTQYWSVFLLAAGVVLVAVWAWRSGRTRPALMVLGAHVVAGASFVAWLPSLVTQLRRTGTPWAAAPNPLSAAVYGFADFAGGWTRGNGLALFAVLVVLVLVGAAGEVVDRRRVQLDLLGAAPARGVTALAGLAGALGLAVVWVTQTAFASRYLSVVVGFVVVLAGRGVAQVPDRRLGAAVLAFAVALGAVGSWSAVDDDRSQGAEVAAAVEAATPEGSLVVVCPDQLGPAVARYLDDAHRAVAYPVLGPARRVDWTDYAARNAAADPDERADRLVELAGGSPVWLVWMGGYRTLEGSCEALRSALGRRLGAPADVMTPRPEVFEPMWLTRFGSAPA